MRNSIIKFSTRFLLQDTISLWLPQGSEFLISQFPTLCVAILKQKMSNAVRMPQIFRKIFCSENVGTNKREVATKRTTTKFQDNFVRCNYELWVLIIFQVYSLKLTMELLEVMRLKVTVLCRGAGSSEHGTEASIRVKAGGGGVPWLAEWLSDSQRGLWHMTSELRKFFV
jgi:hypothetical protein